MLKTTLLPLALIMMLFSSCNKREKKELSTYTITHSTFEDVLIIDGFVESVNVSTISCPNEVDGEIEYIIDDGTLVKDSDIICIIVDNNLQKRYDDAQINLEKAQAGLDRSKANLDLQYALLEAQVKNNAAATAIANLDTLQLNYMTPKQRRMKELELQMAAIEKKKLEKKLKSLSIINMSEIRRWDFEIRHHTNQVQKMKEQIDALTIRAPQAGLATRSHNWTTGKKHLPGDAIWNGMPIVHLPDLTKMKVKIFASEGNYKRINIGDSVEYSFDAMPENKAWGKILTKAPIGQPIKKDSKIKTFEIEASVDKSLEIPGPGLTANCNVVLKRIPDTIVVPQITIFDHDSMKVVYVKTGEKYEMRQVLTGISSQKNSVVVAGLKQDEIISFAKPEPILVDKKVLLPKAVVKKLSPTAKSTTEQPGGI